MTTTLTTLRENVSRILGDWLQISTTTNITTNNYIFSTELQQYGDGYFEGWFARITSGNNSGKSRMVKSFLQSTGRLEVYGTALVAETVAVTVELHRYDPVQINDFINKALNRAYPMLSVQQPMANPHFEDWSQTTYPDYWRVSVITAVKETAASNIHNGTTSVRVTRAGTDGYLYTYESLIALRGQKVRLGLWVLAATALQARLRLYCGSADYSRYSPFHSGLDVFEYLEIVYDVPWDAESVELRCEVVTTDGDVYFDGAGQAIKGSEDGLGYLSTMSAETDATELNADQAKGLATLAASMFFDSQIMPVGTDSVSRVAANAAQLRRDANNFLAAQMGNLPPLQIGKGWLKDLPAEG